jgi:Ca2+-binding EF-hand superfamily protein
VILIIRIISLYASYHYTTLSDDPDVFLKEQTKRYQRAKDKVETNNWLKKAHELSTVTDSDESDEEGTEYVYDQGTKHWEKRKKGESNSKKGESNNSSSSSGGGGGGEGGGGGSSSNNSNNSGEGGEGGEDGKGGATDKGSTGTAEHPPNSPPPVPPSHKKSSVTAFDGQHALHSGNTCTQELDADLFADKFNSGHRSDEINNALNSFAVRASAKIDAEAEAVAEDGTKEKRKVSEKELRQQMAVERDMELFRCFDKDGDGFLDAYEVAAALRSGGYHLTSKEVDKIMVRYDWNGNSKIDFGELRTLAKNNRALRKTLGLSGASSSVAEELRPSMPNVTLHLSIDNYKGEKMVSKVHSISMIYTLYS